MYTQQFIGIMEERSMKYVRHNHQDTVTKMQSGKQTTRFLQNSCTSNKTTEMRTYQDLKGVDQLQFVDFIEFLAQQSKLYYNKDDWQCDH